jgi:uncharacterized membrane protein YhdT
MLSRTALPGNVCGIAITALRDLSQSSRRAGSFPGHRRKEKEMKRPVTREEKDIQIRKEARATLVLFAICFVWNVVFAYAIPGSIRLGGLPLWWLVSTPGMFVVAIIGVVYLLKKVFMNFSLDDEEEGGRNNA